MSDIWIPGWQRVNLGQGGGPYDETAHPKACVHTTEGTTLAGAESAYRSYPPHLGYDPNTRTKHQYVPLNRSSYSFKGGESDDEFIIQVETVGFAAKTHTWSNQLYANFAADVIRPLEELIGIPRQHLRFYRADEGIVLARPTSPVRLTAAALRSYSGWLGHQHIPAPDDHWDPGGFRMDIAFALLEDDDVSASDVWNFPISFQPPGAAKPVTFTAAQYLVWNNYYAGLVDRLFTVIANNEANDLTEAKLNAIMAAQNERMLEQIKNATIDVDVTVGGQAVPTQEGRNP